MPDSTAFTGGTNTICAFYLPGNHRLGDRRSADIPTALWTNAPSQTALAVLGIARRERFGFHAPRRRQFAPNR